jgi:hypothetical protein
METTETKRTIAMMTSAELERYIANVEAQYKARMKYLRALVRALKAEEEAKE